MITSRVLHGQWHIFGDAQPPATGTLNFEPESGLTLDAQRHRQADFLRMFEAGGFDAPHVIRGTDAHAQPLTLFGCAVTRSNASAALDQFEIRPLYALIGAHYNDFREARFKTVNASYSLLDAWLLRSALVQQLGPDGFPTFTQHAPSDISVTLPNGAELTITMNIRQQNRLTSLTLSQAQFVRFTLPNPLPIPEIASDYIYAFARLLSFLAGFEVSVDGVQFPQTPPAHQIEWLHANRGITTVKRELHVDEPLVPYGAVAGTLPALIARWFEYHAEMEPILNLYYTAAHNRDMPANTRFLLLAQALEAYHSRSGRFIGEIQPTADFRRRRDTIVAAVPEEERTWLRENLLHANQKRLAQRLTELIADQQASAAEFITDTALFANTIRWTRNYYTHFAEDEEERSARGQRRIAQGAELLQYSTQMQALLDSSSRVACHRRSPASSRSDPQCHRKSTGNSHHCRLSSHAPSSTGSRPSTGLSHARQSRNRIVTVPQTLDRKISVDERRGAALSDLFQTLLDQLMTAQVRVAELDIDTADINLF